MKHYLFLCLLIILWVISGIFIISASVGFTPFPINAISKMNTFQLIPQGWGFFTRDPREAEIVIYKIDGEGFEKLTQPNFRSTSIFGLSRKGRTMQMQMGTLIAPITVNWHSCAKKDISRCPADTTLILKNRFKDPLIKGKYLVQKRKPIPWAWSKSRKDRDNPYEFVIIDVQ